MTRSNVRKSVSMQMSFSRRVKRAFWYMSGKATLTFYGSRKNTASQVLKPSTNIASAARRGRTFLVLTEGRYERTDQQSSTRISAHFAITSYRSLYAADTATFRRHKSRRIIDNYEKPVYRPLFSYLDTRSDLINPLARHLNK